MANGKSVVIADCLEDKFKANDTDDDYRGHYKLVRKKGAHVLEH
jgi:hypothetical protein